MGEWISVGVRPWRAACWHGGAGCHGVGRIRKRIEHGFGTIGPLLEQERQCVEQCPMPEVAGAAVTIAAIEKRSQFHQQVARFDELQIEQVVVAAHGASVHPTRRPVNREETRMGHNGSAAHRGSRLARRPCLV